MAQRRATSPDGRQWDISVTRFDWPRWPESSYDPSLDDGPIIWSLISYLVFAPILWFVVPLLVVVLQLPLTLVRPLFSPDRWIDAECGYPGAITIRWKTHRDRAEAIADEIAVRLRSGYANLTPTGAERVAMTEPAGLRDLG